MRDMPLLNENVKVLFDKYPAKVREKLLFLRSLIFDIANEYPQIGEIEETLKWGEASYATTKTKSGSTVRIDWKKSKPDQYAIYFHCKTRLVSDFKFLYKNIFKFEGNRAIIFGLEQEIPLEQLKHCIYLSLTYNLNKKTSRFTTTYISNLSSSYP